MHLEHACVSFGHFPDL